MTHSSGTLHYALQFHTPSTYSTPIIYKGGLLLSIKIHWSTIVITRSLRTTTSTTTMFAISHRVYDFFKHSTLLPRQKVVCDVQRKGPPVADLSLYWKGDHNVEDTQRYTTGGFHPVRVGDVASSSSGHYRILHKLGHGSFSTVWLAEALHAPS